LSDINPDVNHPGCHHPHHKIAPSGQSHGRVPGKPEKQFLVNNRDDTISLSLVFRVVFDSVPDRTYDLFAMSEVGGARSLVHTVTASADSTTVELDLPGDLTFVLVVVRAE